MQLAQQSISHYLGLRVGEWVEVRSEAEILSTLDENGRLDKLPFMPQMLELCGRKFQVRKRAHKLCDTATSTGGRKMSNAVFLEELRCDGLAYGGCEMRCLIVWKEAWLKRVADTAVETRHAPVAAGSAESASTQRTRQTITDGTRAPGENSGSSEPVYVCQATEMPRATEPLSQLAISQYVEDYRSGNASLASILSALLFLVYDNIARSGLGFGSAMRWAYDRVQAARGGWGYPTRPGCLPKGARTPSTALGVQVGDLVRVKSQAEILKTVDEDFRNRGMGFHPTMIPYCGREFRVFQRAGRIINERTGKLMVLKNECLVLEGADCVGRYTNPLFCPRSCYPYWREIWLEKVEPATGSPSGERVPSRGEGGHDPTWARGTVSARDV